MAKRALSQNTCSVQTGHIFFLVIRNTIWINPLAKDLSHSLYARFIIIFTLFWRKSFVYIGRVFSFSRRKSKRFWARKGMYQTARKKISRMILTRDLNAEDYCSRLLTTSIWYFVDHISFIILGKSVTNSFTEFENLNSPGRLLRV